MELTASQQRVSGDLVHYIAKTQALLSNREREAAEECFRRQSVADIDSLSEHRAAEMVAALLPPDASALVQLEECKLALHVVLCRAAGLKVDCLTEVPGETRKKIAPMCTIAVLSVLGKMREYVLEDAQTDGEVCKTPWCSSLEQRPTRDLEAVWKSQIETLKYTHSSQTKKHTEALPQFVGGPEMEAYPSKNLPAAERQLYSELNSLTIPMNLLMTLLEDVYDIIPPDPEDRSTTQNSFKVKLDLCAQLFTKAYLTLNDKRLQKLPGAAGRVAWDSINPPKKQLLTKERLALVTANETVNKKLRGMGRGQGWTQNPNSQSKGNRNRPWEQNQPRRSTSGGGRGRGRSNTPRSNTPRRGGRGGGRGGARSNSSGPSPRSGGTGSNTQ